MRKTYFLIILPIFFLYSCASVGDYDSQGDHIFWKIDDGKNTIYILGSIHAGKEEFYPLADTIENAYNKCDHIAVELDLESPDIDISKILEHSMLGGDSTLKQLVSPETYKLIEQSLEGQMSPIYYNKLRPWLVIMTMVQLEIKRAGFDGEYGIDKYFLRKAAIDEKKIIPLEQLDDQLALLKMFDQIPDEYLKFTVEDIQHMQDNLDEMFKYWETGNIAALRSFIETKEDDFPEVQNIMYKINDERNIKMAKKIEEIIDNGKKTFIIVGAAHLIGSGSIIEILRKTENYNIDRI